MKRTVAVINVRMGSTRLPGKALHPIQGEPLLGHLTTRLQRARLLDEVVVATSTLAVNDEIEAFCAERRLRCHRGSEDDVLARTVGALGAAAADVGVVVYGDGPLADPAIVDDLIEAFHRADPPVDFLGNDLETSYPPGMEVEVFRAAALSDAAERCDVAATREHGTLYLRQNQARYRVRNLLAPAALRRPDLSLEVDTDADLDVINAVLAHFAPRRDFGLAEMIAFLDSRPDIAARNRDVPRRWKEFRH